MDFKADGLLLRAADYGENDRMVSILTAERGKVSAAMKGVRKAGAKLRFAAQPFCFAEYVFAEKNGRYTVTQACLHDGFYDLRACIESLYAAFGVLEVCDLLTREGMPSGELLVSAVEALGRIESDASRPAPALSRFLFEAAAIAGYPLTTGDCPVCGRRIEGRRYFDMASGAFNCADCAVGVPASPSTHAFLRSLAGGGPLSEEEKEDGALRALRLLKTYLSYQTDAEFSALGRAAELLGGA